MGSNREGAFILDEREQTLARKALQVIVTPHMILVENTPVLQLGLQYERALQASRAFAEELRRLSEMVADQQPIDSFDLNAPEDVQRQQVERYQAALTLKPQDSLKTLVALRKLGAPLRKDMSPEMVAELSYNGFLAGGNEEEPALTFQEGEKAPILWDMMYEGGQEGLPDWHNFWGFRVPITHWMHVTRTAEIRLRGGWLSAVNEDLDFAGREVALLAERFRSRLPHQSLAQAMYKRVCEALGGRMDGCQLEAWLEQDRGHWLARFLAQLTDDEAMRPIRADLWKQDALIAIFAAHQTRYDLMHFACHCQPSPATEFLSQLEMKVAGEPIYLDVSLMATDMGRKRRSADDPGPLVFLNACSTGQLGAAFEPPGFPKQWIDGQGALAVIATLCPVPDYFAHAFALKFYETLFSALLRPEALLEEGDEDADQVARDVRNRYVAEALLTTRRYFMEQHNNPLGLAYVLYGVKGAHILADFLPGGGAI